MYAPPSGVLVECIARSAVAGGVATGAIGGGALAANGLRPAQPVTKIANAKTENSTSRGTCAFRGELTIGPGSCRRLFLVRRGSPRTPCLQPSRRFGQLSRNFPQKLRRAFFRLRSQVIFDEFAQPGQFFVKFLAYLFELVHGLFLNFPSSGRL